MKTASASGLKFGFSAVTAGQRGTTAEPQVIVVSTPGSFRVTPAISRALGVAHGEYLMFISNVENIQAAIDAKDDAVVEFCEANGLEVGSPEAVIAIHKEFDMWLIAKGIAEFDNKGNAKTITERLSKQDKLKFVSANFDAMLEGAFAEAEEETKEALGRDGITKEEQMEILTAFVTARELPKFKGGKVANSSGTSGSGVPLTFTDTNIWNQLKADMGDDATKFNRIFDIDVADVHTVEIDNGFETVSVKGLLLGDFQDKEPVRIGGRSEDSEEEVEG